MRPLSLWAILLGLLGLAPLQAADPPPIKILFLGDKGHHQPEARYRQIAGVMAKRGIDLVYTDKVEMLTPKILTSYDGVLIYANTTKISPEQEQALLDFVEQGKGLIPIHCASYCFLNSPKYIDLVGAQFKSHGTGTFRTTIAAPDHPLMKGFKGFESWDETYVHTRHNDKNRTVLEYREDKSGKEPWTWVRTQGKGRVFYTAWGHDQRTWSNPGFQELLERGIRWAVGKNPVSTVSTQPDSIDPTQAPFPVPKMTPLPKNVKPFEYVDVGKKIPNYRPRGGQGEPLTKMQLPLPPEESIRHAQVPQGFHVELFASEKDLGGKPICMTWDERGRLWVALTLDYPNELKPPERGRDRIVICEDTDGDGKADKFTTFAEKLSIPTSIFVCRGGLLAFDATQTVFFKDTNGDDKADERTVMFGTWNQGDTHGGPSNMQYGLDNWIWAMQGYNYSRLRVGGETSQFRMGFFRFKPDCSKLEFVRSTDNNTWGLGISEEGIIFGSTANRNPSVYMPIPNRYYEAVRGWTPSLTLHTIADTYLFHPITTRIRQVDQHGGYTAAAGHSLYTARKYPQEYWNRTAFVSDPTGHLTGTFILKRDGSDFHSTNPFNLFASDDEWSAPIMAEVGPDGNVWVIDWYNYIVQHNPTPQGFRTGKGAAYESDLRDKKHGRIYRVVYDGKAPTPATPFTLAGATPKKLVETLKNDNLFWRRHAQRLLVERGKTDIVPDLIALVADKSLDPIGLNVGAIHALWTLHGLGALDGKNAAAFTAATAALKHPSAGVRRNAVQVLPRSDRSVAAILDARLLADDDFQVRLMTLLALADQPSTAAAGKALAETLRDPGNLHDRWIPDAATCAAANNSEHFLKGLSTSEEPPERMLGLIEIVANHYARGGPVDGVGAIVAGLTEADPRVVDAVVRGFIKGWPSGKTPRLDAAFEDNLAKLATRLPAERRAGLLKLAVAWGSKSFEKAAAEVMRSLLTRMKDEKSAAEDRIAAARELVEYRSNDKVIIENILDLITPRTAPEVATGFLRALQGTDVAAAGEMIASRLPGFTPAPRTAGLSLLLSRAAWTRTLLELMDKGKIQLSDLSLDQRQALAQHPDREIRRQALALLKRGGALPNADRQKVIDEFLPLIKSKGDPVAGKVVFKNQCAKCHVHSGEGERIGPDLTGMAVHPKEELLIHILDPSRSVEGNFRVYSITTKKGQVLTGLLASESKTSVELIDAEAKRKTLLREEIDELVASPKSLMPEGFEKQVKPKELNDLLEFLTQRGKFLPLPLDKVATVVSTKGMFFSPESTIERLVFSDWKPKTFEGVPFNLVDPRGDRIPNVVLLYGPNGTTAPRMPRSVTLPCNSPAKAIHLLSGISGWGSPIGEKGSVTLIVRLHYADGQTEDHPLKNGVEFADYIRRVDVPGSKFAFDLRGKQVRYLSVQPKRPTKIDKIDLVKGSDGTAPIVVAVTVETRE